MTDEIWKAVPGYEGRYEVSNLGQVRSLPREITSASWRGGLRTIRWRGRVLKQWDAASGRKHVALSKEGTSTYWFVDSLVAEVFGEATT